MQLKVIVRDEHGHDRLVQLSGPATTERAEVVTALTTVFPAAATGVWVGSAALAAGPLDGSNLRPGALVTVGRTRPGEPRIGAAVRLHVAGGPDAGRSIALPAGVASIGRASDCRISLTDPRLSREHARVRTSSGAVAVRDCGSTNGSSIDGEPVGPIEQVWPAGAHLRLGDSTLTVAAPGQPAAATRPGPEGRLLINRPPRRWRPIDPGPVVTVVAARPDRRPWALVAVLLPALAAAGLAYAMHQLLFLIVALASPVALLAERALGWRSRRRENHARAAAGGGPSGPAAAAEDRARRLIAERQSRRAAHPDAATLQAIVAGPSQRLWERRLTDGDFLDVRLGLADQPSVLRLRNPHSGTEEPAGVLASVPLVVNLRAGALGVCGPLERTRGVGRHLMSQLAVLHSPADLDLAVLAGDPSGRHWGWLHWLPHITDRTATTTATQAALVARLLAELERRHANAGPPTEPWTGRWLVLLIDLVAHPAPLAGLDRLLSAGPRFGITAIALATDRGLLPTACATVASSAGDLGSSLRIDRRDADARHCPADQVSRQWAQTLSRALAPLRDDGGEPAASIPHECRLLELDQPQSADPHSIAPRWRAGGGTRIAIGMGRDGPATFDLAADGPHLLVAGTTGAGKSELLRTLVVALARQNSPRELGFVFIDYKGGAAFAGCARLPHAAGLVTDLDGRLTERALRWVQAELRRRERLLANAGVADFSAYRTAPSNELEPLGRLVLVVDEFAALADEVPWLLGALVAVAQRGRSLGLHLVLATQRPAGVVSAEIQANLSLRIALRLLDPADSVALIGSPLAAEIDQAHPGRALIRTAAGVREFQTARVDTHTIESRGVHVELLDGWGRSITEAPPVGNPVGRSDLDRLVDSMQLVAADEVFAPALRPLPAPLADVLTIEPLDDAINSHLVVFGVADRLDDQSQPPLVADLGAGGALLFAGPARSGRTTVLRRLAGAAAAQLNSTRLEVYLIDCAGGGLGPLATLPQCGTALDRTAPDLIARLLHRLVDVCARPRPGRQPVRLLLIDGWENLVASSESHDSGASIELVLALLRVGASAGLTIAVTSTQVSAGARFVAAMSSVFVLGPGAATDVAALGAVAGGPSRGRRPSAGVGVTPPGRAVRLDDGSEVQFALPPAAGSALGVTDTEASAGAIRIRVLPDQVERRDVRARPLQPGEVLLGVGGDEAAPIVLDLFAGDARWLVAGPPRCGRSRLLVALLEQLVGADQAVLVLASSRSPVATAAARLGVAVLGPDDSPPESDHRRVVLIDDVGPITQSAAAPVLLDWISRPERTTALVLAGRSEELATAYDPLIAVVRRSRSGVLLQAGAAEGELLGLPLPRGRPKGPPGRGLLVIDQVALPLQVAV